jgi:hypothetical protein
MSGNDKKSNMLVTMSSVSMCLLALSVGAYFLFGPKLGLGPKEEQTKATTQEAIEITQEAKEITQEEKEIKQKGENRIPITQTISGCEVEPANLTCDTGYIKTATMKYGRWDNSVCPHATVTSNTEKREKIYNLSDAIGKSSYSIKAKHSHPNVNEDIFRGVYKQWQVDYTCE